MSRSQEDEVASNTSREICTNNTDTVTNSNNSLNNPECPLPFNVVSSLSYMNSQNLVHTAVNTSRTTVSLLLLDRPTHQPPKSLHIDSNLPSLASMIAGQPQPLFVLALAKVNESSLSMAVVNHFRLNQISTTSNVPKLEPSPPDSLTSAPPSYSFVLRQMAARRRPRMVGTFIPSPSFIQHTPPPNYTAAFDIYVENPLPPPPPRTYVFGFTSMPVVCSGCGHTGMSVVHSKVTLCTHLCAFVLCLLCCWICAPLPYILRSCKDVYHYCRNCRRFLGMYCPTHSETAFT